MAAVVQPGNAWIARFVAEALRKVVLWKDDAEDENQSHVAPTSLVTDGTPLSSRDARKEQRIHSDGTSIKVRCYDINFSARVQIIRFKSIESPIVAILSDSVSSIDAIICDETCENFRRAHGRRIFERTQGGVAFLRSFEIEFDLSQIANPVLRLHIGDLNYWGSNGLPVLGRPIAVEGDSRVTLHLKQLQESFDEQDSASISASDEQTSSESELEQPVVASQHNFTTQRPQKRRKLDSKQARTKVDIAQTHLMNQALSSQPNRSSPQRQQISGSQSAAARSAKLFNLLSTDVGPKTHIKSDNIRNTSRASAQPGTIRISDADVNQSKTDLSEPTKLVHGTPNKVNLGDLNHTKQAPDVAQYVSKSSEKNTTKSNSSADPSRLAVNSFIHQDDFTFAKCLTPLDTFPKAQNIALKQSSSLARPDPGVKFSTCSVPPDVLKDLSIVIEERATAAAQRSAVAETGVATTLRASRRANSPQALQEEPFQEALEEGSGEEEESDEEIISEWASSPIYDVATKGNCLPPDSSDPACTPTVPNRHIKGVHQTPSKSQDRMQVRTDSARMEAPSSPMLSDAESIPSTPGSKSLQRSPPSPVSNETPRLCDPEKDDDDDGMGDDFLEAGSPHALGDPPLSSEKVPITEVADGQSARAYSPTSTNAAKWNIAQSAPIESSPKDDQSFIFIGVEETANLATTPVRTPKTLVPGTSRSEVSAKNARTIQVDGQVDSDPVDLSDQLERQFENDRAHVSASAAKERVRLGLYRNLEESSGKFHGDNMDASNELAAEIQTPEPLKRKLVLSPKSTNTILKRQKMDMMTQVDYEIEDPVLTARKARRAFFRSDHEEKLSRTKGIAEMNNISEHLQSDVRNSIQPTEGMSLYQSIEFPNSAKKIPGNQKAATKSPSHTPPGTSSHDSELNNFWDVFQRFRSTYLDYDGSLIHFAGFCLWLMREMVTFKHHYPTFVWDDMIARHNYEYRHYKMQRKKDRFEAVDFAQFYGDNITSPTHNKGVLTKETLKVVVGLYSKGEDDVLEMPPSMDPWEEAEREIKQQETQMWRVGFKIPWKPSHSNRFRSASSAELNRPGSLRSTMSPALEPGSPRDSLPVNSSRQTPLPGCIVTEGHTGKQPNESNDIVGTPANHASRSASVKVASGSKSRATAQQSERSHRESIDVSAPSSSSVIYERQKEAQTVKSPPKRVYLDYERMKFPPNYSRPHWRMPKDKDFTDQPRAGDETPKDRRDREDDAERTRPDRSNPDRELIERRSWYRSTDTPFASFAKGLGALKSVQGALGEPANDEDDAVVLKGNDETHPIDVLDWE